MKPVEIIIIAALAAFFVIFIFAVCTTSSREDRWEAQREQERKARGTEDDNAEE